MRLEYASILGEVVSQCGKLNFWTTHPKTDSPYVLYKIPLAQANFPPAQLKMHSHWQAGEY